MQVVDVMTQENANISYNQWVTLAFFLFYSMRYILGQIDNCIQFGEDADVKVRDFDPADEDE